MVKLVFPDYHLATSSHFFDAMMWSFQIHPLSMENSLNPVVPSNGRLNQIVLGKRLRLTGAQLHYFVLSIHQVPFLVALSFCLTRFRHQIVCLTLADTIAFFTSMVFLAEDGVDIRGFSSATDRPGAGGKMNVVRLLETMDLDCSSYQYEMTSRAIESSSWSSTFNLQPSTFNLQPSTFNLQPSPSTFNLHQMLIIKYFLLGVSFLTQFSILAAPIPLDARALSLNDDTLFSRGTTKGGAAKSKVKPITSLACTRSITDRSFLQKGYHVNHVNHWVLREYVVDNWSFQQWTLVPVHRFNLQLQVKP